jgi:hypothetical protein
LDLEKQVDFIARRAQGGGYGRRRFAAALHAQGLSAAGQI